MAAPLSAIERQNSKIIELRCELSLRSSSSMTDPGILRITRIALSLAGDGLEALEILSREPVDLMVVDL
jgi:hypothetical protein